MEPDSTLVQIILNLIADNEILSLIILGAFLPAIGTIAAKLLMLPVFRNVVGIAAFTWGKTISITLTRWLPKRGEQLETSLQDFVVFFINKVTEGLDSDDTAVAIKPKENEKT
jgi:hypothetical protein